MVQLPRRPGFSGPTLIRLLARLTSARAPEAGQSLTDRLSLWLGWTDAIALSAALNGSPPTVCAGTQTSESAAAGECARVRAVLVQAIADDSPFRAPRPRGQAAARPAEDAPAAQTDYALYRQRYLSVQHTMASHIATLRGRLRTLLAAQTPDMTRLAMVDAIMERALGGRERNLLASVPALLEQRFTQLHQAGQAASDATPGAWLDTFRQDMRSVMLAELDIRLQPVEGLLAALRAC